MLNKAVSYGNLGRMPSKTRTIMRWSRYNIWDLPPNMLMRNKCEDYGDTTMSDMSSFPNFTHSVVIFVLIMSTMTQFALGCPISDKRRLQRVRLIPISVKKRPPEKRSPSTNAEPKDYFEVPRDDLVVRLRLVNDTRKPLYYLTSVSSNEPVGCKLFRKKKNHTWQSQSPSCARGDQFIGDAYQWMLIPPGGTLDLEVLDLSVANQEHAVTVVVNDQPDHAGCVEIISSPYRPQLTNPTKHRRQKRP